MPLISLKTFINGPRSVCFDLSRSIDLHTQSMLHTKERAIAGRTSGLIETGETVTWKALHFGIWLTMTVKITQMNFPESFSDEMIKGPFRSMGHIHKFIEKENGTLMIDEFEYVSPFGLLGKLADVIFLKKYMTNLLESRNEIIKKESERIFIEQYNKKYV